MVVFIYYSFTPTDLLAYRTHTPVKPVINNVFLSRKPLANDQLFLAGRRTGLPEKG